MLRRSPLKRKTPLKRKRKSIKRGRTHFVDYLSPSKQFPWVGNPHEIPAWAHDEAQRRRTTPTPQEAIVAKILNELDISFVREKIWPNGPRPVFSDFYLPVHHHTLEIDGYSNHRENSTYDAKRAMFLARRYKVGTIRFGNREVDDGTARSALLDMFGAGRVAAFREASAKILK